jgi:SAM-dependent methyltransferase/uncharacterized protein YbaR (Trm112 family)
MPTVRRLLRTIPGVEYCYGRYKLQRYRRTYGREFSQLLDTAPGDVPPLQLANSLNQFEWVVRHRLFPIDLLERLMEDSEERAVKRAFANFARGYVAEEQLAGEWQHSEMISEAAELRLTEFLNRYITYALRTFAVHLEMHGNPESSDAIRLRRVLGELEGETGDLLDIGCAFVPLAGRYASMRRWVGLDLSLPALVIGRIVHDVSSDALVCGYSEDLPFADQSFDVVVSSEVLEHTPRPERMVREIARLLRRGGKAVLSVPMHIVDYQDGRQHLIGPTDSTHRFRFHSVEELRALFSRNGLSVERLQSDPHYMFTLRRHGDPAAAGPSGAGAPLVFSCPDCRGELNESTDASVCPACETLYPRHGGLRVLLPRRLRAARLNLAS